MSESGPDPGPDIVCPGPSPGDNKYSPASHHCCRHNVSALGRERPPTLVGSRSPLSDTSCPHSTHRHSQQRIISPRRLARRLRGGDWLLTLRSSHDMAIHVAHCCLQQKCSISIRKKIRICQFLAEEHVREFGKKGAESLRMRAPSTNPLV